MHYLFCFLPFHLKQYLFVLKLYNTVSGSAHTLVYILHSQHAQMASCCLCGLCHDALTRSPIWTQPPVPLASGLQVALAESLSGNYNVALSSAVPFWLVWSTAGNWGQTTVREQNKDLLHRFRTTAGATPASGSLQVGRDLLSWLHHRPTSPARPAPHAPSQLCS